MMHMRDEMVALAADFAQHGGDIGLQSVGAGDTGARHMPAAVKQLCGMNQAFGRHAAAAGAGGSGGAIVNHQHIAAVAAGLFQGGQPGRARPDNHQIKRMVGAHVCIPSRAGLRRDMT
jgi:hypothetical protein